MINTLKNYIASKLYALYPLYTIYTEKIEQGLTETAFFIELINQKIEKQLNNQSLQTVSFDIVCFLDSETDDQTFADITDKLNEEFEIITYSTKKYRTHNKESEVVDGILHYKFDVKVRLVVQSSPAVNMGSIDINTELGE